MKSSQSPAPAGRTRWRRFGAAAVVGFGIIGVLGYLAMSGALALSFAFSGIPFTLTASSLDGNGFVQYAYPDRLASDPSPFLQGAAGKVVGQDSVNNVHKAGGNIFASDTVSQFRSAEIADLNQTVCAPTPVGMAIKVHIIGGGGSNTTSARNLTIQAPALSAASAQFSNIKIGESVADALRDQGFSGGSEFTDPYGALSGQPIGGSFAQGATRAQLTGIAQVGVGTEAGSFTIRGLRLYAEFVGSCG